MNDLYIKPSSSAVTQQWVRPSDWLALPSVIITDDKFVGLQAIFPNGSNYASLTMTTSTGTYTVDWGDGTTTTVASGVTAGKTYDYATYDPSNTTLTSRGYKQAIVTVTANTGLFRTANFQVRRVTSPVQNQVYNQNWLDVICSFPNLNSGATFVFGGISLTKMHLLEQFKCLSIGSCSNLTDWLSNCRVLESLEMPNTINVTSFTSAFANCFILQNVPLFNTQNATGFNLIFQNCYKLKNIPFFNTQNVTAMNFSFSQTLIETVPLFNTSSCIIMSNTFDGCRELKEVPLFNTSSVQTMLGMFNACISLKTIPIFNTINVTTATSMFSNCTALEVAPFLNFQNVTNGQYMFFNCSSLISIPNYNFSKLRNLLGMFQNATSLTSIPAYSLPDVTLAVGDFTSFALGASSLNRCQISFKRSVNFTGCQLSQTALVEIFTNLADRTSTTSANINITGNWGASVLTVGERAIATAKNWTITG